MLTSIKLSKFIQICGLRRLRVELHIYQYIDNSLTLTSLHQINQLLDMLGLHQLYYEECSKLKIPANEYLLVLLNQLQMGDTFELPAGEKQRIPEKTITTAYNASQVPLVPVYKTSFKPLIKCFANLPLLKVINLKNQELGDEQFQRLLGAFYESGCELVNVNFTGNNLSCFSIKLLFHFIGPKIEQINISNNPIEEFDCISDIEKVYPELKYLEVMNCGITQSSFSSINKFVHNNTPKLVGIDLSQNDLSSSNYETRNFLQFIQLIKTRNIKAILQSCKFTKLQLSFIQDLANKGDVIQTDLYGNEITLGAQQKLQEAVERNARHHQFDLQLLSDM